MTRVSGEGGPDHLGEPLLVDGLGHADLRGLARDAGPVDDGLAAGMPRLGDVSFDRAFFTGSLRRASFSR
ncbi:MAG: hypothetical protein ABIO99_01640 [Candidatus Limnocylindria bacterium]